MSSKPLEQVFPNLAGTDYRQTSPFDPTYNCIAWAAGDKTKWWEPDPWGDYYWAEEAPREYTVRAYQAAFATLGYTGCTDGAFEPGYEKVAIYAKAGRPKHASRQLQARLWTSKLGEDIDISHEVEGLCGEFYGSLSKLMKRAGQRTS
jgi:hypothetical protein